MILEIFPMDPMQDSPFPVPQRIKAIIVHKGVATWLHPDEQGGGTYWQMPEGLHFAIKITEEA